MFKKARKSNYYFDSFPVLAHFSTECGKMIVEFMENFDPKNSEAVKTSVHEIEHEADKLKHEVTEKLLTEFMTPIDREDIFELLRLIDDVTDAIEEISLKLFIYNYQELPHRSVEFAKLILRCMEKTEECLSHFPDYLDKEKFSPYVNEVIKLEEESDDIYIDAIRELYLHEKDALKRHLGESMYTMLEETADKCREVCRYVQNIAFKNI